MATRRTRQVISGRISRRTRRELAVFAAIYALYDAARWLFAGHLRPAVVHAHWIVHLERSMHVAIEGSVQQAARWGPASWLLANVYLVAQLAVLPVALHILAVEHRRVPRQDW